MELLTAIRPRQWAKNLVVFAPVVFASQIAYEPIARSVGAFFILCALSSGVYLLNDIRDKAEDARHPTKRLRPIASGRLSSSRALSFALILIVGALTCAYALSPYVFIASLGFLSVNAFYSYGGKRIPILDVMLIGASFVARVLVGAAAILVPASAWLLLTLFFLATYLGFTKRYAELRAGDSGSRASLGKYTVAFLVQARSITLGITLALYTLYTFVSPLGESMALTVPFVFFGLMRYQAIADGDTGENDGPSHHVYEDRQLQTVIALWALVVIGIVLHSS